MYIILTILYFSRPEHIKLCRFVVGGGAHRMTILVAQSNRCCVMLEVEVLFVFLEEFFMEAQRRRKGTAHSIFLRDLPKLMLFPA